MKRKIALGPGAASLILIVVILSLCMLTMLMQIGARNDLSLATRGTEMITRVYNLFSGSEQRLSKLDAYLRRCQQAAGKMDEEEKFACAAYLDFQMLNIPKTFINTKITEEEYQEYQEEGKLEARIKAEFTWKEYLEYAKENKPEGYDDPEYLSNLAYLGFVMQNMPEGFALELKYDKPETAEETEADEFAIKPLKMNNAQITWQEPLDKRVLTCTVRLEPLGAAERTVWVVHTLAEQPQEEAEGEEIQ